MYDFNGRKPRPASASRLKKPPVPYGICCFPDCDITLKPGNYFGPVCGIHAYQMYEKAQNFQSLEWTELQQKALEERRKTQAEKVTRLASKRDAPGWVYYVLDAGLIKIGFSTDVKDRMRNRYTPAAELLAVHPGTKGLEHQMHLDFADLLVRGREWFKDDPRLRAHIARVVGEHGSAEQHAYHFTERGNGGKQGGPKPRGYVGRN